MTFWEALGLAVAGVGGIAAFIGMMWWTLISWAEGDWPEKVGNLLGWVLVVAFVIWRLNRVGGPA